MYIGSTYTWQHLNGDTWVFGPPYLGIVRQPLARVCSNKDLGVHENCWHWTVQDGGSFRVKDFMEAIEACERVMLLLQTEESQDG